MVFETDLVEITKISTWEFVVQGISQHPSKEYIFSHFIPYTILASPHLLFKADECIKIPSFPIANSVSIPDISDSDSEEESSHHDPDIEIRPQRDLDPDPTSTSF